MVSGERLDWYFGRSGRRAQHPGLRNQAGRNRHEAPKAGCGGGGGGRQAAGAAAVIAVRDSFHDGTRPPSAKRAWSRGGWTMKSLQSISRDGKRALLRRLRSRGDNNLYLLDLASGKDTLITKHEGVALFSGDIAPDGAAAYIATNKDRDLFAFRAGSGLPQADHQEISRYWRSARMANWMESASTSRERWLLCFGT